MDESKRNPGNANLPIGVLRRPRRSSNPAIQENGVPWWNSRGYLPHAENLGAQHVTFHLADSLAKSTLQQFETQLKFISPEKRDVERHNKIEAWMDAGHGSCILRVPSLANDPGSPFWLPPACVGHHAQPRTRSL